MARPPPTPCRVCSRLCVSNKSQKKKILSLQAKKGGCDSMLKHAKHAADGDQHEVGKAHAASRRAPGTRLVVSARRAGASLPPSLTHSLTAHSLTQGGPGCGTDERTSSSSSRPTHSCFSAPTPTRGPTSTRSERTSAPGHPREQGRPIRQTSSRRTPLTRSGARRNRATGPTSAQACLYPSA